MSYLQIFLSALFVLSLAVKSSEHEISKITAHNITTETITHEKSEELVVKKWKEADKAVRKLSSMLVKNILPFAVSSFGELNLTTSCSRSLMKFLSGVKQSKLWAFQMLDSSGKIPNGLFSGNVNSLGDYDECIETVVCGHFQGQYCLLDITPPLPERRPFVPTHSLIPEFINITDPESLTTEFLRFANHYYYIKFRSSVCMPSTCSAGEIRRISEKVLEHIGINFEIAVTNCEIKEKTIPFSNSEITIMSVFCFILSLGLVATVTDVCLRMSSKKKPERLTTDTGTITKCLLCFSFYTNTIRLLKKDNAKDSLKVFHGMRVITILWVILNHTYYYTNLQVFSGLLNARKFGKEIGFQLIANGFLNVETFFFISSVLVAYGVMNMKEKKLNVFLFVFRRLWRLTPPFMFVIASVYILPRIGSGPVWKETVVEGLSKKCAATWWKNLLYINNFIPSSEMCLQWTWYIPVDTHLYFVSLFVLLPLKRNPKLAFLINGVIFIIGIVVSAISNVYYNLHPTAIYVFNHPDDIDHFIERGYFRTYLHFSTYCVGLTVGYLLAKRKHIHIPLCINLIGWLTSFVMGLSVLYGVYDWNQGNVPGIVLSTVYTCTNKLAWSLALAWVTFSCITGNGGIVTSILSWEAFVPFGRLTYMAYLVHPIIQFIYIGSTRTVIETTHRAFVYMYLSNVVLAFMCAYVFSLLFESPFMALEKVLLGAGRKSTNKPIPPENKNQDVINNIGKIGSSNVFEDKDSICTIKINS